MVDLNLATMMCVGWMVVATVLVIVVYCISRCCWKRQSHDGEFEEVVFDTSIQKEVCHQPQKPFSRRLDLHGHFFKNAMEKLADFLNYHVRRRECRSVLVITGQGKHSPGGIPKIKPAAQDFLDELELKYKEQPGNPGALQVNISKW